jgi:hypothetical protein
MPTMMSNKKRKALIEQARAKVDRLIEQGYHLPELLKIEHKLFTKQEREALVERDIIKACKRLERKLVREGKIVLKRKLHHGKIRTVCVPMEKALKDEPPMPEPSDN